MASEAAIASYLVHKNIVATYSHDVLDVAKAVGNELGVFKFYLIQVRPTPHPPGLQLGVRGNPTPLLHVQGCVSV